jgi:pyruvate,water dikinase
MHTKNFKQLSKNDVGIAGGKGASLGEMTQAKISVPPGFVVLAGAFERFLEETDLGTEIESRLKKVNYKDINSVDRASNEIRDLIHDEKFPKDIGDEILESFGKLGADYVAVRSSATAEDSSVASWAGELETYLNTTKKTLLENVKKCWSSLFTPRAIFYRFEKGLAKNKVSVAVVVQKMIQSEISGITFTAHPVTQDRNQMVLEAGYGLGEAIVGGLVTPDTYIVQKPELTISDINISEQSKMIIRAKNGGVEWKEVPKNKQGKQKLTGAQIIKLAELCVKIEKHYNFPQDIEWAMEKSKFYITQSRPITTL